MQDLFVDKIIRQLRSRKVREEDQLRKGVNAAYYQIIDCLEVKCDTVTCAGLSTNVKYHYVEVPPIESIRSGISYFGLADGMMAFNECGLAAFNNAQPSRLGRRYPKFTRLDNKLFLKFLPTTGTSRLRLVAVLEDPAQNVCGFDFENDNYPIPQDVVHQLELLAIQQILSTSMVPEDDRNNGVDDTRTQQPIRTPAP